MHAVPGADATQTNDTIVAVSSPAGVSARAIIRLSGPHALGTAAEVFEADADIAVETVPTYRSVTGHVRPTGETLRCPAVLYVMRAPSSYTREDVVEIHTVGSPPLVKMILEALLARGARLAEPGEFTRRAFLHGRIDLVQAESVMAVIRSRSEAELRSAVACLRGRRSEDVAEVREALGDLCAHVELMIDFSDQDIDPFSCDELRDELLAIVEKLNTAAATADNGTVRTDAVAAAIYGRPNVGKSSLMNALGVSRRAIVTDRPGTTRDTVADLLSIGGIRFRFVDTAGLRRTEDDVERLAADRARQAVRESALALLVLDGSSPLSAEDEAIAHELRPPTVIAVINKCDLPQRLHLADVSHLPHVDSVIVTSALTGAGMAELKQAMVDTVVGGKVDRSASVAAVTARQRDAIQRALSALDRADALLTGDPELQPELVALELREALSILGEIAGEVTPDDLLDRIFSEFCIGK